MRPLESDAGGKDDLDVGDRARPRTRAAGGPAPSRGGMPGRDVDLRFPHDAAARKPDEEATVGVGMERRQGIVEVRGDGEEDLRQSGDLDLDSGPSHGVPLAVEHVPRTPRARLRRTAMGSAPSRLASVRVPSYSG